MGLFDIFKKKTSQETTQHTASEPAPALKDTVEITLIPDAGVTNEPDENGQLIHWHYDDSQIEKLISAFIDQNGLKGLSKEEAALAKPFFVKLYSYYHNNAVENDHSLVCTRKKCDLKKNQPVFKTISEVLCRDCAIQYVIGNVSVSDWYYFLDNLTGLVGMIPPEIKKEGEKAKEEIASLRTEGLSDDELIKIAADNGRDMIIRRAAAKKIKDPAAVDKLAEETDHYSILLDLLKRDLPRETVLKILDKYKGKTKSQNSWAESVILTAVMKLDEDDLKMVLDGKVPGADVLGVKNFAIAKIEDKAFLQQYIQTEKSEMQKQIAIKRLQQLEK